MSDINDVVDNLAAYSVKPVLDDNLWTYFGYKKRPKRGAIFSKLVPEKHELENFILQQVITMSIIDTLFGIKHSKLDEKDKLLLAVGLLDRTIKATKHMISPDDFVANLIDLYEKYLKSDKNKIYAPVIAKSKKQLSKKNFAKFMVGTTYIFSHRNEGHCFLDSDIVTKNINKYKKLENKLQIDKSVDKYVETLLEKVIRN